MIDMQLYNISARYRALADLCTVNAMQIPNMITLEYGIHASEYDYFDYHDCLKHIMQTNPDSLSEVRQRFDWLNANRQTVMQANAIPLCTQDTKAEREACDTLYFLLMREPLLQIMLHVTHSHTILYQDRMTNLIVYDDISATRHGYSENMLLFTNITTYVFQPSVLLNLLNTPVATDYVPQYIPKGAEARSKQLLSYNNAFAYVDFENNGRRLGKYFMPIILISIAVLLVVVIYALLTS